MTIDISMLCDLDLNIRRLKDQLDKCNISRKRYLLYLFDREGKARTAVVEMVSKEEGVAYKRNPIHGVNEPFKGDTYKNLVKILAEGFKSEGFNATIYDQDVDVILSKIANKTAPPRYLVFGDSSINPLFNGDRYFLEFKRFLVSPLWTNKEPQDLYAGYTYVEIREAETRDIEVHVILGTVNQAKTEDRIHNYLKLFHQYQIKSHFFNKRGLLYLNDPQHL